MHREPATRPHTASFVYSENAADTADDFGTRVRPLMPCITLSRTQYTGKNTYSGTASADATAVGEGGAVPRPVLFGEKNTPNAGLASKKKRETAGRRTTYTLATPAPMPLAAINTKTAVVPARRTHSPVSSAVTRAAAVSPSPSSCLFASSSFFLRPVFASAISRSAPFFMRRRIVNTARNPQMDAIAPGIVEMHTRRGSDDAHGAGDPKAIRAVSGATTAAMIGPAKTATPHPTTARGTVTHTCTISLTEGTIFVWNAPRTI